MAIRVDPGALRAAASSLSRSSGPIDGVSSQVGSLTGATHPEVLAGVESFSVAWSVALEVMADDVIYVADRATTSANLFEETDGRLADSCEDPNALPPE